VCVYVLKKVSCDKKSAGSSWSVPSFSRTHAHKGTHSLSLFLSKEEQVEEEEEEEEDDDDDNDVDDGRCYRYLSILSINKCVCA
jgi:hypothetical protein